MNIKEIERLSRYFKQISGDEYYKKIESYSNLYISFTNSLASISPKYRKAEYVEQQKHLFDDYFFRENEYRLIDEVLKDLSNKIGDLVTFRNIYMGTHGYESDTYLFKKGVKKHLIADVFGLYSCYQIELINKPESMFGGGRDATKLEIHKIEEDYILIKIVRISNVIKDGKRKNQLRNYHVECDSFLGFKVFIENIIKILNFRIS